MEQLFDTHFHLDLQKNISKAIEDIESNGIYTIAVTNLPDLFQKEKNIYQSKYIRVALGMHPELVHEYSHQISLMWKLLSEAKYIGEVGLDFTDKSYYSEQVAFFEELVDRCRMDATKIMTIHSRKAASIVLDIIGSDFKFKPILHWFVGTQKELDVAIEKGYYFSVNSTMLASKKSQNLLLDIPRDRLLIETDAPFGTKEEYINSLSIVYQYLTSIGCSPLENFRNLLTLTID